MHTQQCYCGRPLARTSRRPRPGSVLRNIGYTRKKGYTRSIATSCKQKPVLRRPLPRRTWPGAVIWIRSHGYYSNARTCHRRRRSRRKPASCMHGIRNMQVAGSPAVASRPAEAALCLESRASIWTRGYHPNMPDLARASCAHSRPLPIRGQCLLDVGWARLAHATRLAPTISLDSSRSNVRGSSDPRSLNGALTLRAHDSPGILQNWRGTNAASELSPSERGCCKVAHSCT